MTKQRGNRKKLVGLVTSDKMHKTRRVEVDRLVKHPRYGKYIRRRTVCHAHDEHNETRIGDRVELMECRPLSRTKRWVITRVLQKATSDVAEQIGDQGDENKPNGTKEVQP